MVDLAVLGSLALLGAPLGWGWACSSTPLLLHHTGPLAPDPLQQLELRALALSLTGQPATSAALKQHEASNPLLLVLGVEGGSEGRVAGRAGPSSGAGSAALLQPFFAQQPWYAQSEERRAFLSRALRALLLSPTAPCAQHPSLARAFLMVEATHVEVAGKCLLVGVQLLRGFLHLHGHV